MKSDTRQIANERDMRYTQGGSVYAIDNSALHSQSHEVFLHLFIHLDTLYILLPNPILFESFF